MKKKHEKAGTSHEDHSLKAYQGIRRMLYHKEIVPGQKIPYRELAERLKMSPTPIIQALKWLELQGFVRHEPNRGYYMTPFSIEEVREIFEVRLLIEPSLIQETVKRLQKDGVKELKTALKEHRSAHRDYYFAERLFKNRKFRMTLASFSGKGLQIRILENIFDLLLLKYGGNYLPLPSLDSVDEEHQEIVEQVIKGNWERARDIMKKHIKNVEKQVIKSLKQMLMEMEDFKSEAI